jgi:1-acyl-sn-glycerol-3-phosphate acyltransferase
MKRLFALLLGIVCFWQWPRKYKAHIEKITASGQINKPSRVVIFLTRCIGRFLLFFWLGRVRVKGHENLYAADRLMVTPNHSTLLDAILTFTYIRRDVWAMGADDVLKTCFGITGLILTKLRCLPVDRSRGKTVVEPAVRLVKRGHAMVMYPEGKISPDATLLPFKPGAAVIGNQVLEELDGKERVGIVPSAIFYHRRHNPTACDLLRMGFKWRKGATLVFCEPIWLNDLEDRDPCAIMEKVKAVIEETLRQVEAEYKNR